jgi:hypothetical protein
MSLTAPIRREGKGRRGARNAFEEGGRYLGVPQNPGHSAHEPVTINPVSTKSGAEQYGVRRLIAGIKARR